MLSVLSLAGHHRYTGLNFCRELSASLRSLVEQVLAQLVIKCFETFRGGMECSFLALLLSPYQNLPCVSPADRPLPGASCLGPTNLRDVHPMINLHYTD